MCEIKAPVIYRPKWVESHGLSPKILYERLSKDLDWIRHPDAPRSEYWTNTLGKPYTYGRGRGVRTYESQERHSVIDMFRTLLLLDLHVCKSFHGCFLNHYHGKRDWLGWYEDDDPGINHEIGIAIVTLGAGRAIQFRERLSSPAEDGALFGPPETLFLEPGSLAYMKPGMQSTHQHRIPKADRDVEPRISMTYRSLLT